jgi:hypothetical protein
MQAQAPQPDHDVHDSAYYRGRWASCGGRAMVSRVALGFSGRRKARLGLMAMAGSLTPFLKSGVGVGILRFVAKGDPMRIAPPRSVT